MYFDPKEDGSIRETVCNVMDSDMLSCSMIEKGYVQLKKISWKKCAEETERIYEMVLR